MSSRSDLAGNELFIKSVDAVDIPGNTRFLTYGESPSHPDWFSDGTKIVFEDANRVHVINTSTGATATQLTVGPVSQHPTFSPVDDRIAYSSNHLGPGIRSISVIFENTDNIDDLTNPGVGVQQVQPDWSPDGARIVYSENDGIIPGSGLFSISSTEGEAGGVTTVVPRDGSLNLDPAWSPDGKWIAYASDLDEDFNIFVAPANGPSFPPIQITSVAANDVETGLVSRRAVHCVHLDTGRRHQSVSGHQPPHL